MREVPVREVPVREILVREVPVREILVREVLVREILVREVPVREILVHETQAHEIQMLDELVQVVTVDQMGVLVVPMASEIPMKRMWIAEERIVLSVRNDKDVMLVGTVIPHIVISDKIIEEIMVEITEMQIEEIMVAAVCLQLKTLISPMQIDQLKNSVRYLTDTPIFL